MSHLRISRWSRGRAHSPRPRLEVLEDRRLLAGIVHEFPIFSKAESITRGPDGNLWMTSVGGAVERLTPDGQISRFVRDPGDGSSGDIVAGPDGNLWSTTTSMSSYGQMSKGYLHRITPSGALTSFSLGNQPAAGLAVGTDGALWVVRSTDYYLTYTCLTPYPWGGPCVSEVPHWVTVGPEIDRIATDGSVMSVFPLGQGVSNVLSIVAGADGNLWFTEGGGVPVIGRITPGGQIREFPLPAEVFGATAMTVGPDGNPWFVETTSTSFGVPADRIATIAPDGQIREVGSILTGAAVTNLTTGPDGNIWFIADFRELRSSSQIGRLTPSGTVSFYDTLPPRQQASDLTTGPDGNIWFTQNIARVGQVVLADIITANGLPLSVDGNQAVHGTLATFDAAEMDPEPGDFTALIDWGDGSTPSPGVIALDDQGGMIVQGGHVYAQGGYYTVTTTIKDAGGASATTTSTVIVPLRGAMDPASDTGPSATDAVTSDTRPTFAGTAAPGEGVLLVVQRAGTPGLRVVGGMITGPDGSWRIQSSTLEDGLYTVGIALVNPKGDVLSSTVLHLGSSGGMVIDTTPPRVVAVSIDPSGGHLIVAFQDNLSSMDPATLVRPKAYRVSGRAWPRGPVYRPTAYSLFPPPATADQPRLTALTINGGRPIRPGRLTLRIASGQITDLAGNPLEVQVQRRRPPGHGRAVGDFVARFAIRFPRPLRRASV